ncbi:hypothetical protein NA8A_18282 [Nitratireductor indicus C115]|uniref:Uncharacterized protein n=1 Tax=Nitratireductor indicus C115 TaxID=1231190 RepID=K2P0K2_9HYPH|nr:hypothetical protein [Nitratireductor indicus]EKF40866.1 hypothetical protein NA8A_18282 [Nitratireductor indicus C115]SFQ33495.1 hypothetical protein SAMN05216176_102637 [Nitratireductor indicus]
MSKTQYEVGRAYWLRDGREVEYLGRIDDGKHVVAPTIELETYEGYEVGRGHAEFTSELFTKPPVEKRSEQIASLQAEVRGLENRKNKLYSECLHSERDTRARLDRLKKFEGLERIEEFVEGRITHVVIESYGDTVYDVLPLGDLQQYDCGYSRKPEGVRLISLFGLANGDLQWKVNQWRDESGTWRVILPCISEDDAREKRRDLIQKGLAEHWAEYMPPRGWQFLRFAAAAITEGIELSADQNKAYCAAMEKAREQQRENLIKEIADRQMRLDALSNSETETRKATNA